ncbi:MAG TPA: PLP-dependent aminotransferase family protein [Aliidongia sp.]|uniref:MocR-like pyridoxine biosynthesis transcription factor PdxR n=1 Tax=Aliidongia sp. TaxID=1914230 RepID=UPI002DDD34BA|nr:PLP-dependent aminotransferase family protein [Aliidongia sp.]HEV2677459.1 PLP-dependent aminotransferase family protein [Aliidongia sp.]
MDPLFEITLDLAAKGSREASRTLCDQLRAAILDGRLRPGAKLPATRKSESFFGVSRNTALEVYDQLLYEGYVVARHGSGTYVADTVPTAVRPSSPAGDAAPDPRLNAFWLRPDVTAAMGFWRDRPEPPVSPRQPQPVDFRPALIDSRLFPFDTFRQVSAKQLRGLENKPARYKSAQGNQGNYRLRDAITKHIALTRAVVCRADDIVVTSGAQQAFDLLARVLVTSNETVVAVEDPGYPPMRVAFAAAGAKLVPVEVDGEGLVVERLPPDVGIICLCPSHQFPLGVTLSPCRRQALIAFARRHGAVIIEDDYDGEFRNDGAALEALRTADAADVVFYVGTFSKCMLPALRLGFVVAPDWALRTLVAAKNCLDWHCSTPVQMGVAGFIAEGHLAHHVRKMRRIYRQRRERLLGFLRDHLDEWLEPIPSLYGMHVAAAARADLDLDRVTETLLKSDVKIHAFSRYYLGPPTMAGLIFGYGAVDLPEMERGLAALREALRR